MRLAKLDERMEKLEDAAIAGIIDTGNFNQRKEKLLLERTDLIKSDGETEQFHRNPAVVRQFLERLKNLAEHYEFAAPAEKREIVENAVSNRSVKDKTVFAEPSNWLAMTQNAVGFFSCAQPRATSRTSKHLEYLADVARSSEVRESYKPRGKLK